jgi:hypothetical protein
MSTFKWATDPQTLTVSFFHRRIRELVAERLEASGRSWEEAVWDPSTELTREDFERIEQELLDTGHRFEMSARISIEESPEKYRAADIPAPVATPVGAPSLTHPPDGAEGTLIGTGDNVFRTDEDVVGTARVISTVDAVLELLTEGVPPETVAFIDDSGGTLTAPILEDFTAVVCRGGTVRSHLGILTREYRIPCLMAAEVTEISDGDKVRVQYTAQPVSSYKKGEERTRARIWKLA